jgi:hypothetical protein
LRFRRAGWRWLSISLSDMCRLLFGDRARRARDDPLEQGSASEERRTPQALETFWRQRRSQ